MTAFKRYVRFHLNVLHWWNKMGEKWCCCRIKWGLVIHHLGLNWQQNLEHLKSNMTTNLIDLIGNGNKNKLLHWRGKKNTPPPLLAFQTKPWEHVGFVAPGYGRCCPLSRQTQAEDLGQHFHVGHQDRGRAIRSELCRVLYNPLISANDSKPTKPKRLYPPGDWARAPGKQDLLHRQRCDGQPGIRIRVRRRRATSVLRH